MIARSLTPSVALHQPEATGPPVFPSLPNEHALLLCVIETTNCDDTSADWRQVRTAGLGPFLFVPARRHGVAQFAVDLPADVGPSPALCYLMEAPQGGSMRLRYVSAVSITRAGAVSQCGPQQLLRVGLGGEVLPGRELGEDGAVVRPTRRMGGDAISLLQLLDEAAAFSAALVERFVVGAEPSVEEAARAVCFVRDFVSVDALGGGVGDVLAAWSAVLLKRRAECPERTLGRLFMETPRRATPCITPMRRASSPGGARNNNPSTVTGTATRARLGSTEERPPPILSVCEEVIGIAAQQRPVSRGTEGFLPALLRRIAEDTTQQGKELTGNECNDGDTNDVDKNEKKKEASEFILDTRAICRGDVYPTSDMIDSADLLRRDGQDAMLVFFYDLDPLFGTECGGPFPNAFGGGGGANCNAATGSSANGHPCYLSITHADIILRSAFEQRDGSPRLVLVIPRVSLVEVQSNSSARMLPSSVMRLQTRSCRRIWLNFLRTEEFDAALRHITQCTNVPHGNPVLACAQRSWRMSALALIAGGVLPGAGDPFYKQALRNLLVATAFVEDRRRRYRRERRTTGDFFDCTEEAQHSAGIEGGDDEDTVSMDKVDRGENLMQSRNFSNIHTDDSNPTNESNDLTRTHLDESDAMHWWFYSASEEYKRQKIPPRQWKLSSANRGGRDRPLSTYPEWFVVPNGLTDAHVIRSAAARARARVEALTFYYPTTGGGIVRTAQPAAVISLMPQSSSTPAVNVTAAYTRASGHTLCFLDLRSGMRALGSTFVGGGFAIEVARFCSLGNIHVVRNAYESLCADVLKGNPSFPAVLRVVSTHHRPGRAITEAGGHGADQDGATHDVGHGGSAWLHHIGLLLRTAVDVARLVAGVTEDEILPPFIHGEAIGPARAYVWTRSFTPISPLRATQPLPPSYTPLQRPKMARLVVLNCSDGWDRTPQVCALAAILLDPYYRSAEGFLALIEKEFLAFGHPSLTRASTTLSHRDEPQGNGNDNGGGSGLEKVDQVAEERVGTTQGIPKSSSQCSPILLQFFDAVYQLVRLYPNCFEITEAFLLLVADVMHAGIVGTFAVNCEADVQEWNVEEETLSLSQFFAVLLATTIPSGNGENTNSISNSSIFSSSDPNPLQNGMSAQLGEPQTHLQEKPSANENLRHYFEEDEEPREGDVEGFPSTRLLLRIGGGGPSFSPFSSPLGTSAAPTWRRLCVSRDAMEFSGLLNPHFSMLDNQRLFGPLLDPVRLSFLAPWDGFFLRHNYWCERRLRLRSFCAVNWDAENEKEPNRRAGVASASEMQTPGARPATGKPLTCHGAGGAAPRTLTRPASYGALSTLPQQKPGHHAHARAGIVVATVGGGGDEPRLSSPSGASVSLGAVPRKTAGRPPPLSPSASSLGHESLSPHSVEVTQRPRSRYNTLLDELDQAYDE